MMKKIVEKKILPEYFDAIIHDKKRFDIRKDEDELQKILIENKALRAENKELRTKAFRNSWEKSPDMMGR